MRYNLCRLINIVLRTLILYLFLGKLIGSLILSIIITLLSNLSIVKKILGLSIPLVKLEDSKERYLAEIKEEIDRELSNKGINKINYSLEVIDEGQMIIYGLGDNRIYLDSSFLKTNKQKLKAVIYHELGHIYYGDITWISSMILGNLIFLLLIEILIIVQGYYLLALLMIFIIYININIKLLLFNKNNLKIEIRADRFVVLMGYGSDLLEVLLEYKYDHDKKQSNIGSPPSKKYLELKKRVNEIEKNEA